MVGLELSCNLPQYDRGAAVVTTIGWMPTLSGEDQNYSNIKRVCLKSLLVAGVDGFTDTFHVSCHGIPRSGLLKRLS
jgi:hypothetical protein